MSERQESAQPPILARRSKCRLCDGDAFAHVLPVRPSPIGDAFVPKDRLSEPQSTFPLDAYLCRSCGHLQNLDMVRPDILFGNYTYRTAVSLGLVEHFRKYAEDAVRDFAVQPGALVVEIGSNDGSLLRAFKAAGLRVQGVDAAQNVAAEATDAGVPTLGAFFTDALAEQIRSAQGEAALVCANNVYAHIDDMAGVTRGIRRLLAPDGVFIFEVSYVLGMIDNMAFDTIYHEHVSYHALLPLERFLNRLDLTLFDAFQISSKGGSVRAFAQPLSTAARPRSSRLEGLFAAERERDVFGEAIYRSWFERIEERRRDVQALIDQARASGKSVAGWGASTSTTTLLYHFELQDRLDFIIDDNPAKQGMFSPGRHLPIFGSTSLDEQRPDMIVILAWLYADAIISKNSAYLASGGQFIVPLPDLRVVSAPDR